MSRRFAVKVLFGDLAASPVMRSRFAREAETASRLEHPNQIQVVDFGESEQGLLYLVMSFVEGRTLERIVRDQGALPQATVIELAKGLCRGLRHAHMRGLVHRDFKPENVIVVVEDAVETPKIVDFGVALDAGGEGQSARLTRAGHIVGTPAFMSPEQALAEDLDARSDLFSFGLVLYNLLTGLTPWDARGVDVLAVMITQPAPEMAERKPEVHVSPGLEAIVMRLLEKDRDERFASAEEALEQLSDVRPSSPATHAVTRELPMHVLSTGEAEALGQWRSRRALWLGLTGLVMIAAATVFVITLPGTLDPGGSEPAADVFNVEPLVDSAAVVPLPGPPKPSIVPPSSVADAV